MKCSMLFALRKWMERGAVLSIQLNFGRKRGNFPVIGRPKSGKRGVYYSLRREACMAGHSKWANIKHRKERSDKKKGKIFSRIVKEIISAVKQGGADLKTNSKLRAAIQKAKDANVPNENV